jgi:hypothetical protein
MARRRTVREPAYLEFGLLMLLIPLLSPQGWDYVLLVATPAVMILVDRWRETGIGVAHRHGHRLAGHRFHDHRPAGPSGVQLHHADQPAHDLRDAADRGPWRTCAGGDSHDSRDSHALLAISRRRGAAALHAATLKFEAPAGWVSKPPASTMRVVEYTLPKVAPDTEDAALAVYFFGPQAGTVQANLDRWIGQMTQPDGRASKDVARTSTFQTTSGLKVSLVDLTGTYVAEMSPGSADHFNKPGFRLRLR